MDKYSAHLMYEGITEKIYAVNLLISSNAIPITLGKLYVNRGTGKSYFLATFGCELTLDDLNGIIKVMKFIGQ